MFTVDDDSDLPEASVFHFLMDQAGIGSNDDSDGSSIETGS